MKSQKYKSLYSETIYANVAKRLDISNPHKIPKIKKIVINRGLGESAQVSSLFAASRQELATITGQHSVPTLAKKSIAGFKIREDMTIGCKVTLRGERMYAFLDRLVHLALPRIRDFRGIKRSGFDGKGNQPPTRKKGGGVAAVLVVRRAGRRCPVRIGCRMQPGAAFRVGDHHVPVDQRVRRRLSEAAV